MNMTILQESALMMQQVEIQVMAEGSLLRMSDADQTYALDYADGEDFDMDLNM